ncbi:MAG: TlpA family protein disulfide reductase [Phycisphaerae bacterium]
MSYRAATCVLGCFALLATAAKAEDFDTIKTEFTVAQQQWFGRLSELEGKPEAAELYKNGPANDFVPRVQKLVESLKGDDAIEPLMWLLVNSRGLREGGQRSAAQAADRLARDHADSTKLLSFAGDLRVAALCAERESLLRLFERIGARGADSESRALGRFLLGFTLQLDKSGDTALPVDVVAQNRSRALELMRSVLSDFEVTKAAAEARGFIFELERLQIGMVVPPLEGKDPDGQTIRLADHAGKVVVIDFWATWCWPCRQMLPHLRELSERMRGRPFALLAVSSDSDVAALKRMLAKERMTWLNILDGEKGRIATEWNIYNWPTTYVIDHEGRIRHRDLREKELDEAVVRLVEAAEKSAKK